MVSSINVYDLKCTVGYGRSHSSSANFHPVCLARTTAFLKNDLQVHL
jgi:hypothetical protein